MQMSQVTCRCGDHLTTVSAHVVSANFFDVAAVQPIAGRAFSATEGRRDLTVITYGLWQRLGGDAAVVGRSIQLNGWPYEIIGVLPKGFAATAIATGSLYVPISPQVAVALDNRRAAQFDLFGRLRDGVTREQAAAALQIAARRVEAAYPDENTGFARGLTVSPIDAFGFLRQLPAGRIAIAAAATMFGLVGLVLITACANVAGLLISWIDERRRELAVRVALGATRAQLTRQLLAESFVISSLGCAGAAALWILSTSWLRTLMITDDASQIVVFPASLPLGYCLLLLVAITAGCGVVPAWGLGKTPIVAALQKQPKDRVFRRMSLQRGLVTAQIAICCVLLTADALLLRNLLRLQRTEPGFDISHVVELEMRVPTSARPAARKTLTEALAAVPGVQAVSWGSPIGPPFTERVQSGDSTERVNLSVDVRRVGPRFFETIGAPIVLGRDLSDEDLEVKAAQAVVVNETFVRRYPQAGGADPIGRTLLRPADTENGRGIQVLRIVGVARDSLARTIGDSHVPVVYLPQVVPSFIVRTAGPPASSARLLEQTVERLEPAGTVVMTVPMERSLAAAMRPLRIATLGLGVLGVIGCALGMAGLFAVISRAAARRTFEIAVRVAIGAPRSSIIGLIVRDALRMIALGCVIGTVLAFGVARVVQSVITTQSLVDPVAFTAALVVLIVIGMAASLQPAWRAGRTDPINALRSE
jgi:putative ABC transport system permease protein